MNVQIRRVVFLIIPLLFLQNWLLSSNATNYKYINYNSGNGLSSNSISCIFQDSRGLVWVGSYYGLNKFDGYSFEKFFHNPSNVRDPNSLSSNYVTAIIEDNNNNIWIGTKMGLNVYQRQTEKFAKYLVEPDKPNSISNNYVYTLFLDNYNTVWVGTMGGGIQQYREAENDFISHPFSSNSNDLWNHVSAIVETNTGEFCVGTYGNGLMIFNPKNGKYEKFEYPGMEVNKLLEDSLGNIWVGTNNIGLFRFSPQTGIYEKVELNDEFNNPINVILGLIEEKDYIIASSDGGGIQPIEKSSGNAKQESQYNFLSQLNVAAVFCVYNSSKSTYWIGTIGNGLYSFNTNQNHFSKYSANSSNSSSLSHNNVISAFIDSKKRVWIGTDGGGVNLFDIEKGSFKSYKKGENSFPQLKSNIIRRISEDNEGNIWLGTYNGGFTIMSPESGKSKHYELKNDDTSDAGNQHVWAFAKGESGQMWVGSLGAGLFLYIPKEDALIPLNRINPDLNKTLEKYILSLHTDNENRLWIGTSNGLAVLEPNKTDYSIYLADSLNNSGIGRSAITDICAYNDTTLLLGTNGDGFWRFNPKKRKGQLITTKEGLIHDKIFEIITDRNNEIWITTLGGLSKFDITTNQFYNYDEHDGLMESAIQCGLALNNGKVLLGGTKGINLFNPKGLDFETSAPSLLISKLLVNNQAVMPGDETGILKATINETNDITLKYPLNSLSFEYVGISNYFPSENSYSYILEGLHNNWSPPSLQRRVDFSNLPPGKYILRIRTANNKKMWSKKSKVIYITVLGPWWKSWWAYVLYFGILATLIIGYIHFSVKWFDLRRRVVFETMEHKKISHLNELRLQFFTNISHEFRTPLSLINGNIELLIKNNDLTDKQLESLSVVERNSSLLNRLINQLLDFRKSEEGAMELNIGNVKIIPLIDNILTGFETLANTYNIKIKLNNKLPNKSILIDEEVLEKALYNTISNAIKFTPEGGEVSISAEIINDCLKIEVADTGVGISEKDIPHIFERYRQFHQSVSKTQPGTGIGLALTKSLIELHGGTIELESRENNGTIVTFCIPTELVNNTNIIDEVDNITLKQNTKKDHLRNTNNKENNSKVLNKHSVLIVDDNNEILDLLENSMDGEFNITRARDGKEALDILTDHNIDLIVSDIMMPVMDGITFCNKVKEDIQTSHIPVVLLTAKASNKDTLEGLLADADAYIPKPFSTELLIANCQMLIRNRTKLRQQYLNLNISDDQPVDNIDSIFMKKLLGIIKENMNNENATVDEISKELGMSRSNLHRKVKALTGKSITEFSRSTRLAEGAKLILQDQMQVSEVAYEVGFNSVSYFIRSFKDEYKLTPSQYKSAHLKWK